MARRKKTLDTETLREELSGLVAGLQAELRQPELRSKVLALVPVVHKLGDLGRSLIPQTDASSARDRILFYMRSYPQTVVTGDELYVVSGIGEWARRVRELRVQFGWPLISGLTANEMLKEGEFPLAGVDVDSMRPDHYILLDTKNDPEAAMRWHMANEIRKGKAGVRDKILLMLRKNIGKPVMGEELRYVAGNKTEWARRVRELRTELGWPISTKAAGRPDLPVGVYVLEEDRQSPVHDRKIRDEVRMEVLRRDRNTCQQCGWTHDLWSPSDPRHLELHHVIHHVDGGMNTAENLVTLCTRCHDKVHRGDRII